MNTTEYQELEFMVRLKYDLTTKSAEWILDLPNGVINHTYNEMYSEGAARDARRQKIYIRFMMNCGIYEHRERLLNTIKKYLIEYERRKAHNG